MSAARRELEAPPDRRDGKTIGRQVPAGATDDEQTWEARQPGTITQVMVRIYEGAELDLELEVLLRKRENETEPLVEPEGSKGFIDGDDDVYTWELEKGIGTGEEVVVRATNQDGTNPFDYRVNFDVDWEGGRQGPLRSLVDELREVLS